MPRKTPNPKSNRRTHMNRLGPNLMQTIIRKTQPFYRSRLGVTSRTLQELVKQNNKNLKNLLKQLKLNKNKVLQEKNVIFQKYMSLSNSPERKQLWLQVIKKYNNWNVIQSQISNIESQLRNFKKGSKSLTKKK